MHTEESTGVNTLRSFLVPVMQRNAGRWSRFILAILKNEADAEDVLQEAVRRVLARDRTFESEDQVRMYLGRAIGNAALELYNCRKKERMQHSAINEQTLLPACICSPFACMDELERSIEMERLLSLLDEGLKRLPLKQYEALRLTVLESRGLSIRDVGMSSGIPYSTLRHRSKQGLKRLRRFLEKYGRQNLNSQRTKSDHD